MIDLWEVYNMKEAAWYYPNSVPVDENFESNKLKFLSTENLANVTNGSGNQNTKGLAFSGSVRTDVVVSLEQRNC